MDIILALCAATVYGVADYCGGRASRSVSAITVTFVGQSFGFAVLLILVLASGVPTPPASDWFWAGLGGIAGSTGLLAFYRAMGSGFMTVVAPISAVTATAVPVVVGLLTGERPGVLALLGIPLALIAIALVSDVLGPHHRRAPMKVLLMAFGAGAVFGSLFVILRYTSDDSGLWPVVAMRVTSVPYMFIVMRLTKRKISEARANLRVVAASGIFDSAANALYLLAVREGLMSIVATINSFYPASTLLLATKVDKERIHRAQAVGLGFAVLALVLISLS
ncbi:MAG: EamA family transporter [Acidimicrobiaceae bacterium]|nr:DMT family transporter [Ilumatobacteraceae bacterium]